MLKKWIEVGIELWSFFLVSKNERFSLRTAWPMDLDDRTVFRRWSLAGLSFWTSAHGMDLLRGKHDGGAVDESATMWAVKTVKGLEHPPTFSIRVQLYSVPTSRVLLAYGLYESVQRITSHLYTEGVLISMPGSVLCKNLHIILHLQYPRVGRVTFGWLMLPGAINVQSKRPE